MQQNNLFIVMPKQHQSIVSKKVKMCKFDMVLLTEFHATIKEIR